MKKKFVLNLCGGLLILSAPFQSGCALFLLGAGGAAGYAVSSDEIEGLSDVAYDKVWRASKEVLLKEGALTLEDKARGRLEAVVDKSKVEVTIEQPTPHTIRFRVKARKVSGLFPDMDLAEDLYNKIMKKAG